ncbi:exonuclease DPD1, chloroplastic/mitochondrial [Prunus avium]|uniref:Exonuclease DPD1, chloroplastic/mitochondrial n=1 Tax=Prunus avium TaxID=42229 RepID=A0A6P5SYC9_PRUAV|nr:exonuclease DPD1, chloroplastic/mitochondrial [Prunus avium]XP_021821325.1 exonuclease DPD1, chloroplastic/mitochondrial [Prunus avium]
MRTVSMCFSSFSQVPRCRIYNLAHFWSERFHNLSRTCGYNSSSKIYDSKIYMLDGGNSRKWTRRSVTTNTQGRNKSGQCSDPRKLRQEILDVTVSTSATLNLNKIETSQYQQIQHIDIRQLIAQNKDLASLVTVIVFDTETTGFSRERDHIIEIALQDLQGGENSTFQTLVNPECRVLNSHIHGITTNMVNRPDVPRMEDLIPILLKYVKSRQKPGGCVLFVAHNARTFDVPFLCNAFRRCGVDIPSDWLFKDTLPMGREAMKSEGSKPSSRSISLQALREHLGIPLDGSAHRAMSDVKVLAAVFQRLTYMLKLPLASLVEDAFTASEIGTPKKKSSR